MWVSKPHAIVPAIGLVRLLSKMGTGEIWYRQMVLIWLLALCHMQAIAQTSPVQTVRIKSAWGGLSPTPVASIELLVQRQADNSFYSNGTSVLANLIESLVQALGAPLVDQPRSSNLGITQKWHEDSAEDARKKRDQFSPYSYDYYWPTFQAAFANRSLIEAVLPSLFSGMHTDDEPPGQVPMSPEIDRPSEPAFPPTYWQAAESAAVS